MFTAARFRNVAPIFALVVLGFAFLASSQTFDWRTMGSNTSVSFNHAQKSPVDFWQGKTSATIVHAQSTHKLISRKKSAEPKNEKLEAVKAKGQRGTHNDRAYEAKHKNSKWFRAMSKPNADYFAVKKSFDKYFGTHQWEESRCRQTGEGWIKSKIFYLDKNGKVQAPPPFEYSKHAPRTPNHPALLATTRTVGTWYMIGPVNNQSPNGNEGGYVALTRFDPTNLLKIFSSFQWGGLWVTIDGGTIWTLTDINMPDEPYNDLDVAISNPLVVYAISASHVIKSTDGGFNWSATTLTSASYSGTAYDIAVSPTNPDIVVARWGDKVYRTTNGGTTWASIVTGLPDYAIWEGLGSEMLDWSLTDNNVVYLLSTSTSSNNIVVYRSGDAGASFSIITTLTVDPTANGQIVGWGKILQGSNNASDLPPDFRTRR